MNSRYLACLILLLSSAGPAASQNNDVALIDQQLRGQLDLRDTRFSRCYGRAACSVDGYRVSAWRKNKSSQPWQLARLYWDPVDGFGILRGGQDDEIDFNERLIIEFPSEKPLTGIWLTDLFVAEAARYGDAPEPVATGDSVSPVPPVEGDAETADIVLSLQTEVVRQLTITGNVSLPNTSFNETIDENTFDTGADLVQRLRVENGKMVFLAPPPAVPDASNRTDQTPDAGAETVSRTIQIGRITDDKADLFAGETGAEYDLSELLPAGTEVALLAEGSPGAKGIESLLEKPEMLDILQQLAEIGRAVGDVPNGEVAAILDNPIVATSVTFFAKVTTSNDFSVAGIMFSDR